MKRNRNDVERRRYQARVVESHQNVQQQLEQMRGQLDNLRRQSQIAENLPVH